MVRGILSHLLKRDDGPKTGELVIDGRRLPVTFRRQANARRIVLRLDRERDGIVLTLPPGASAQTALEFAAKQAGWIWTRLERAPESVPFLPGETVPVRGVGHVILHDPVARGLVRAAPGATPVLLVPGGLDHVPRRISDWLKAEARRDVLARSREHAEAMGVRFGNEHFAVGNRRCGQRAHDLFVVLPILSDGAIRPPGQRRLPCLFELFGDRLGRPVAPAGVGHVQRPFVGIAMGGMWIADLVVGGAAN